MRISILLACLVLFCCSTPAPAPTSDAAPTSTANTPTAVTPAPKPEPIDPPGPPAPPPKPDPRTPPQIAAAACAGRCQGTQVHVAAASAGANPIILPSWTVPAWFIDPANSVACASDSNSGTAATCTGGCAGATCPSGIGPVVTYQEINTHRWSCQGNPVACPRLQQNTTLTFLSSQAVSVDPVVLTPEVDLGSYVVLAGALGPGQTVCSGVLSAVTNLTVASNLLTQATLPCTATTNELVIDTTNASSFWTYKVNGAAPAYFMSQPVTPAVPGAGLVGLSEVGIVNGDAVTVYNPVQINLVQFSPIYTSAVSTTSSGIFDLTLQPGTAGRDGTVIGGAGPGIAINNILAQRGILYSRASNRATLATNIDLYAGGVVAQSIVQAATGGLELLPAFIFQGGILGLQTNISLTLGFFGVEFDTDVIFTAGVNANRAYLTNATIGAAFIDNGNSLTVDGKSIMQTNLSPGVIRLWGTGGINTIGKTIYPAGAGGAAGAFKSGLTLNVNNFGFGCIGNPASTGTTLTCNSAVTAANMDTVLGTTVPVGCLFFPGGGGAFCNGQ